MFRYLQKNGIKLKILVKPLLQKFILQNKKTAKSVIFIAGVQRSGTNMVMNTLDRHLYTDVYHDSDTASHNDYELREIPALQRLCSDSPANYIVLKAICEHGIIDQLLNSFDNSKLIWIVRNYNDVINSHIAQWSGMPESIRKISHDRDSAGWRGIGISDKTHNVIKNLYTPDISNASACALFWYMRNIIFFEKELDKNPNVLAVKYESLVTEPIQQFEKLFSFANLKFKHKFTNQIYSSSIKKNFTPRISPKTTLLCENLYQKFERQYKI